jgi:hypothetical protein
LRLRNDLADTLRAVAGYGLRIELVDKPDADKD